MYAQFFGLKHEPFSIAPDPRYLFMSERHREALAHLLFGLNGGGGFVLLSGEIGAGKTTVCRCFLEQIPPTCNVAYIFNPKLSAPELLASVCEEFHIVLPPEASGNKALIDALNAFLLANHAQGRASVLIIDEAQNLESSVLEQLRLLTNLETNERKLLQIILIGQPELRNLLAQPELEQLAQRVIARFHLGPLSPLETASYIGHRMAVAGRRGPMPFDAKALQRIASISRGVPRRINLLCGRALLGAYASGQAMVTSNVVKKAALEVFGEPNQRRRRGEVLAAASPAREAKPAWTRAAAWGGGIALLAAGLLLLWTWNSNWNSNWNRNGLDTAQLAGAVGAQTAQPKPAAMLPAVPAVPAVPAAPVTTALPASAPATPAMPETPASSPALPTPPALLAPAQFAVLLAGPAGNSEHAWQALARLWDLPLPAATAKAATSTCALAASSQVQCFGPKALSLAEIRQLDRPGIVSLAVGDAPTNAAQNTSRTQFALLLGLSERSASLKLIGPQGAAPGQIELPLALLAKHWRGDFSTLWRMPRPSGALGGEWLSAELAKLNGTPADAASNSAAARAAPSSAAALRAQISAFQKAQGLAPDGQLGSLTSMQLSRALGSNEPRLRAASPAPQTPPPAQQP